MFPWPRGPKCRFEPFCKVADCEQLMADPRFDTFENRSQNSKILNTMIEPLIKAKTVMEWKRLFESADIPHAAVNDLDEAFSHPQVVDRKVVAEMDYVFGGKVKTIANPVKLSLTPPDVRKTYLSHPVSGQHTREVLSSVLNYSMDKIDELIREKTAEEWVPGQPAA
ncbi:CoA transferase [Thermodesulfobacteriota bacterium]